MCVRGDGLSNLSPITGIHFKEWHFKENKTSLSILHVCGSLVSLSIIHFPHKLLIPVHVVQLNSMASAPVCISCIKKKQPTIPSAVLFPANGVECVCGEGGWGAGGRRCSDDLVGVIGHVYVWEDAWQRSFKVLQAESTLSQLCGTQEKRTGTRRQVGEELREETQDHDSGNCAATFSSMSTVVSWNLEHNRWDFIFKLTECLLKVWRGAAV